MNLIGGGFDKSHSWRCDVSGRRCSLSLGLLQCSGGGVCLAPFHKLHVTIVTTCPSLWMDGLVGAATCNLVKASTKAIPGAMTSAADGLLWVCYGRSGEACPETFHTLLTHIVTTWPSQWVAYQEGCRMVEDSTKFIPRGVTSTRSLNRFVVRR